MGWLITNGYTRADVIRERTESWRNAGVSARCLAKAVRGNVLWTVWQHERVRTMRVEHVRYIGCDLLGTDGGGNWGYKDLSESMGPNAVSCPLSFLDMVPEVACAEWRDEVRAHHARRRVPFKLSAGVRFKLQNCEARFLGEVAKVETVRPLVAIVRGLPYRIKRHMVGELVKD